MGKILKRNQPCSKCSSSDAAQLYDDDKYHCFSCGKTYGSSEHDKEEVDDNFRRSHFKKIQLEDVFELPTPGLRQRRITRAVNEFFGVRSSYDENGNIDRTFFPISEDLKGPPTGYKTKKPEDKKATYSIGAVKNMFGLEHFKNGGKRIIITEGEEDALSIATSNMWKYGKIYPVASMGGVDQVKFIEQNRETLRKFNEVILWFDNDEQGQGAVKKAARAIGVDKAKFIVSKEKDANDVLMTGDAAAGCKAVWNYTFESQEYTPAGIVKGEDTWGKVVEFDNMTFVPWPPYLSKLNKLSYGRAMGSITMVAAGTSVGKSTWLREDIYHLLNTTDFKIGACFLEEDIGETVTGIMSLHVNKRLGLPDHGLSNEEKKTAWEETVGKPDRTMFVDHQGSVSDGSLIDKIEHLAVNGCKMIYLDHITIAVSESEDTNVNTAIDKFMSSLLKVVKRHGVWICVVSHLRKVKSGEESFESGAPISEDDLKGSGSLKQISFQTIALSRNKLADNPEVRHTTRIYLLKDRKTGNTGSAGAYKFNVQTGRLDEVTPKDEDEFEIEVDNL
jgi:twinkle protein